MSKKHLIEMRKEFSDTDKEKLNIFLYNWFSQGLLITQMDKQVVDYMRSSYHIEYKDFFETVKELKETQKIKTELDGKQTYTSKGKDYIDELIAKHGNIPININWVI
jgi:hypothetical protein